MKDFTFSHILQAPSCCMEVTCNISPGWGYSGPSVVKDQKCAVGCSSSFLCTIWKPQNSTAVHQSPFVCWIWRYKEVCVEPLICSHFKCKFCKYFFHYTFIFSLKSWCFFVSIQVFLYGVVFCCHCQLQETAKINRGMNQQPRQQLYQPRCLPLPLLRLLTTERQREWWNAIYSLIHAQAV